MLGVDCLFPILGTEIEYAINSRPCQILRSWHPWPDSCSPNPGVLRNQLVGIAARSHHGQAIDQRFEPHPQFRWSSNKESVVTVLPHSPKTNQGSALGELMESNRLVAAKPPRSTRSSPARSCARVYAR